MTATSVLQAEDPEVEFLYAQYPEPVECQMCGRSLDHLTYEEREDHYSVHFAEQEMDATAKAGGSSSSSTLGGEFRGPNPHNRALTHLQRQQQPKLLAVQVPKRLRKGHSSRLR